MHILLTRPLDDCKELILRFKFLGHKVSHLPVIKIQNVNHDKVNVDEFGGIIFTSANAIKNLNTSSINKQINCFCVGSSTEKVAKQNGFQNIFCADGNVNNLKEVILQNFDNKHSNLLYVSGEIISSNLDKDLISEGYIVKRIINYSVVPNDEVSDEFIRDLKSSIPDIVYVYSENSARNYLSLLKKYKLSDCWMDTNLMCLGEKTSSVLNEIKWKKIFLFNSGEEEFLLYKI
ncbi:MAG TPA: uroporphyrinogen-III synthase [Candidatus Pelagibacter bacterium]|nr:uroporphyrinogen-III synthase [Candidatus Pelagibacter bacterium]